MEVLRLADQSLNPHTIVRKKNDRGELKSTNMSFIQETGVSKRYGRFSETSTVRSRVEKPVGLCTFPVSHFDTPHCPFPLRDSMSLICLHKLIYNPLLSPLSPVLHFDSTTSQSKHKHHPPRLIKFSPKSLRSLSPILSLRLLFLCLNSSPRERIFNLRENCDNLLMFISHLKVKSKKQKEKKTKTNDLRLKYIN